MSAVNITNVTVLDNPAPFSSPFQFEISYECVAPLKDVQVNGIIEVSKVMCIVHHVFRCYGFVSL
ncbi:hypothetical protein Pint_18690 [Pistacia integerrima]|uniref:Uncharacterized protein n=1 Tax=Pistacia integerrima TaxID=434235 RepID=A0ACC0YX28_9ROSI|nr:hypothetical protein Pint_18690 [Pistacia integerrima]